LLDIVENDTISPLKKIAPRRNLMSRKCQVTGKKPVSGRKYAYRGIAKKQKGIGLNITGKTKRRFCPNLHKKRFWYSEENRWVSLTLSSQAIRTITKKGLHAVLKEMKANDKKRPSGYAKRNAS
jgi:large subunit ribosomal protein L28